MTTDIMHNGMKLASLEPVTMGQAPDFILADQNGDSVQLSKLMKPVILSVFPDLTHEVCSLQTKRFNTEAALRPDFEFISISTNSAEQAKAWCAAAGSGHTMLSDDGSFGRAYGLILDEDDEDLELARAVYLIDENGKIIYSEIVENIGMEADYEALLSQLRRPSQIM